MLSRLRDTCRSRLRRFRKLLSAISCHTLVQRLIMNGSCIFFLTRYRPITVKPRRRVTDRAFAGNRVSDCVPINIVSLSVTTAATSNTLITRPISLVYHR